MAKKTTKEHFVQQRYLGHFASDIKREKIHVYDKKMNDVRGNQPIKDCACEGGFYDINTDKYYKVVKENKYKINEEALTLLHSLGNFTDDFLLTKNVELLYILIEDIVIQYEIQNVLSYPLNLLITDIERRAKISYYVAFQYLRTRAFREYLIKKMIEVDSENIGLGRFKGKEVPEELKKVLHSNMLFNISSIDNIAHTIFDYIWIIGINNTEENFYTSDNPIVVKQGKNKTTLFSDVLEISFPLSNNMILICSNPLLNLGNEEYSNQIVNLEKSGVEYFNQLQVSNAERFVYCCLEEQLLHLKKYNNIG